MDPLVPLTISLVLNFSSADVWKIFVIILCIILGGFYAASETALSQCNRYKITARAESGNRKAKIVLKILNKFDDSIINILICINVTHIVPSIMATFLLTSMFPNYKDLASIFSTIIMTLLIFLFSEMLPKSIANLNSDKISEHVAFPIYLTGIILTPISFIFRGIVYLAKKLFRISDDENKITEDDFQDTIDDITDEGLLNEEEGELIQAAVEFGDFAVSDVITPVEKIVAYEYKQQSRKDIIAYLRNVEYSRIPVYEQSIENVIGILHVKKYLLAIKNKRSFFTFKSMLTRPLFINENTKIVDLLAVFQQKRTHIAIVKSHDNTKIIGMVTMEDLVEKLVGDIDEKNPPKVLGGHK